MGVLTGCASLQKKQQVKFPTSWHHYQWNQKHTGNLQKSKSYASAPTVDTLYRPRDSTVLTSNIVADNENLFFILNSRHSNEKTHESHGNHNHSHDNSYQPHDDIVVAVNRKNGNVTGSTIVAQENHERVSWGGVALDSRSVYATSIDGLYKINKGANNYRWKNEITKIGSEYAPLVTDERVYACGRIDGGKTKVVSVQKDTGETSWSVTLSEEVSDTLTIGKRNLFVTTNRGIHALDSETGERKWRKRSQFGTAGAPRYVSDFVIDSRLVNDGERKLVVTAIDKTSGDTHWNVNLPAGRPDSISVDKTKIYAGTRAGIIALGLASGQQAWRHTLEDGTTQYKPPVITSNTVMAVRPDGNLHAVQKEHGNTVWTTEEIAKRQVKTGLVCIGRQAYFGTPPGEIKVLTPDSEFLFL